MRIPRILITTLILVAAISPLGINLYLPSMPAMARALGVEFAAVQISLSVYLAAVAAGQLVAGPLSDSYGRRPVLLIGLGLFVLGSVICMLAPNTGWLNLGRVVQGLGGCAGITLSRAIVRDLYDRQQAAVMIGYVTMGMAVGPMLAPTIGGVLEAWIGWRAAFGFLAVFGVFTIVLVLSVLQETRPRAWPVPKGGVAGTASAQAAAPPPSAQAAPAMGLLAGYGFLLRSREFWGYSLTTAFTSAIFYAFIAGASFVVIELMQRSPIEYGMYFGLVAFGYILGNFITARYSLKLGQSRLFRLGLLSAPALMLLMCGFFALGWLHPLSMFGPMFAVGVSNGLVMPAMIAGAVSVRPEASGAASGLAGSLQIGMGALIAPVVGAIMNGSVWPLLWVMTLSSMLAVVCFRLTGRSRRETSAAARASQAGKQGLSGGQGVAAQADLAGKQDLASHRNRPEEADLSSGARRE